MLSNHLFLSRHLLLLPQYFPASGSLPISQLFTSDGQNIGISVSTSVFSMNTQDWYPLGWTGWISLQSKGLSGIFPNATVQKYHFFGAQLFYSPTLNPYLATGKTIALTRQIFDAKVMSLLFIFYFSINLFILIGGKLLYILYWFYHSSTGTCHRCTCVPHPVPTSHLPPRAIPLGHPSAPAPSILCRALNLDWWFISYMVLYMFQCHSPKSPHPLPQRLCFLICCLG